MINLDVLLFKDSAATGAAVDVQSIKSGGVLCSEEGGWPWGHMDHSDILQRYGFSWDGVGGPGGRMDSTTDFRRNNLMNKLTPSLAQL